VLAGDKMGTANEDETSSMKFRENGLNKLMSAFA
jgi:hypothetical protein